MQQASNFPNWVESLALFERHVGLFVRGMCIVPALCAPHPPRLNNLLNFGLLYTKGNVLTNIDILSQIVQENCCCLKRDVPCISSFHQHTKINEETNIDILSKKLKEICIHVRLLKCVYFVLSHP